MKSLLALLSFLLYSGSIFCQSTMPIGFEEFCTLNTTPIGCFSIINGDTRNETNKIEANSYRNCFSSEILQRNPFTGNDVVYRFEPGLFGGPPITFSLTSERDLDLLIVECIDGEVRCVAENAGSTGNESLTIEQWSDDYLIVIDAYDASQNAPFELNVSCYIPCDIVYYEPNCDLLDFKYSGEDGALKYSFSVPNGTEAGYWSARELTNNRSLLSFGTGQVNSYTFNTRGGYEICYTYPDTDGCDVQCCKNIWIDDPASCSSISSTIIDNNHILYLPNSSNEAILHWINTANERIIANGVNQIAIPLSQITDCTVYAVKYFDAATDYYRVCSIELCPIAGTAPSTSLPCCPNEAATQSHLVEAYSKMCKDCEVLLSCVDYEGTQAFQVAYPSSCFNSTADYISIYFDCQGRVLNTELIPLETWNSTTRNELLGNIVWSCGR